jgi:hypothetical protein
VVVFLGVAPLLVLEWLQSEGTYGGLRRPFLWGGVGVVLLLCGLIAVRAVGRLAAERPGASHDVWAVLVAGAAVWLVLSPAAPLVVLVRSAVDETVGIAEAGLWLYLQWALAVLLAAGLAVLVAAGAHHYLLRGHRRAARSPAVAAAHPFNG